MKKVLIALIMTLCMVAPSFAYDIDGILDDWGVYLSSSGADRKGYLDSNLPSGGRDIDYGTPEDNAGVKDGNGNFINGWQTVGPGSSFGSNNPIYNGKYLTTGNNFDAEAIYFDNDDTNAYIAVVMGLPINGGTAPGNPWFFAGDIGIDVNRDGTYEFGIDVLDTHTKSNGSGSATLLDESGKTARLFYGLTAANWSPAYYNSSRLPDYNSIAGPWEINSGSYYNQLIDFAYGGPWNTHYVLEAAIPLDLLGLSYGDQVNVHWTMECGNDYITTLGDVNTPEPASLSLLGLGLLGLLGLKKKRA